MLYVDYMWQLGPGYIIPDPDLNTDQLGWKEGDFFKIVVGNDGKKYLRKVDKLQEFILKGVEHNDTRSEAAF